MTPGTKQAAIGDPDAKYMGIAKSGGPTRQELMEAVKAKKITNFRVMNKTELAEIVKPDTTNIRIKEIQETAIKRWKSGWNSRDKKK